MDEMIGLTDASFTSSTIWDNNWPAKNMQLSHLYGWMPSGSDPNPWIQVDMLNVYTIIALYLQKYNLSWYVTKYSLKASLDGNDYQYIAQNIETVYVMDDDWTTYLFENATDGRYWRIEPIFRMYVTYPFIKGDFIGIV